MRSPAKKYLTEPADRFGLVKSFLSDLGTWPLTIGSRPEALNVWVSRRASRMPTIWNACSLVIASARVWLYSELNEKDPRTVGRQREQGPDVVSQDRERDRGGVV